MSKTFTLPKREKIIFQGIHEFTIQEKLGVGAFGTVYKSLHKKTQKTYAIKVFEIPKLSPGDNNSIIREITIQKKLDEKNLIKFYDFFKSQNKLYLILEYLNGGNLFELIHKSKKKIPYSLAQKILKDVLKGISKMHKQNFIQRDIKPENILLSKNKSIFKICDFGWSGHVSDIAWLKLKGGTVAYMAPESLLGILQTQKVDSWAVGILLYEILFKKEPFNSKSVEEQLSFIRFKKLELQGVHELAADFIRKCLVFDFERRPGVLELLQHPFLKVRFGDGEKRGRESSVGVLRNGLRVERKFSFCRDGQRRNFDVSFARPVRRNVFLVDKGFDGHVEVPRFNYAVFQGDGRVLEGSRVVKGENRVVEGGNRVVEGGNRVVEGGNRVVEGGNRVVEGGSKGFVEKKSQFFVRDYNVIRKKNCFGKNNINFVEKNNFKSFSVVNNHNSSDYSNKKKNSVYSKNIIKGDYFKNEPKRIYSVEKKKTYIQEKNNFFLNNQKTYSVNNESNNLKTQIIRKNLNNLNTNVNLNIQRKKSRFFINSNSNSLKVNQSIKIVYEKKIEANPFTFFNVNVNKNDIKDSKSTSYLAPIVNEDYFAEKKNSFDNPLLRKVNIRVVK